VVGVFGTGGTWGPGRGWGDGSFGLGVVVGGAVGRGGWVLDWDWGGC